ncbi:type ISP restriction/modification enzyme [Paracoccus sp. 228]|uniref:type ISP restriction/modification enzyme n=1 Tax=Paracoccus sp. 228 TaxID=1192054 RepID=UPI0035100E2A
MYNDYVYFWRWALWRLFEKQTTGGIITFITASSFLGGPAFVGMREYMRREFDDIFVVNLGGDLLGTRKTPNVFNIQTPVAITIGVRSGGRKTDTPATVRYLRVEASDRKAKLTLLDGLGALDTLAWESVSDNWMDPFYPKSLAKYFSWPELTDLFPWQHSGSQFKRVWPIGENKETLEKRWEEFRATKLDARPKAFKETRDRKIVRQYDDFFGAPQKRLGDLTATDAMPAVERYCYRSFDRHVAMIDNRLGDYLRPPLVTARGERNVFFASLMTKMLGVGAAMVVSPDLPDLDVFCGRGGKDVIPLYRDAAGTEPNVTAGLLDALGKEYGTIPSPEDVAAYVYALLGGQSYTRRFWNELETPGPRVPMTKDGATFAEAANVGRRLIWLHTYAERFRDDGCGDDVPQGKATTIKGVSSDPKHYPEDYAYDPAKGEISVGDGRFGPVAPEVWDFEVSGLEVVKSWLGYRMKKRAGKKSSPLDDIRPERWTARMNDEFLELLWVLESTLAMEPELEKVLDKVVAGPCFAAADLPAPKPEQRKAPGKTTASDDQPDLFGGDDEDGVAD